MTIPTNTRLQNITDELREIKLLIESEKEIDLAALDHFRDALNEARLVSWVVSEWLHAGQSSSNPGSVVHYFANERLRRFSTMAKEIDAELANLDVTAPNDELKNAFELVEALCLRLRGRLEMAARAAS